METIAKEEGDANDTDAVELTIADGARYIYALYASGVIGKGTALKRLAAFLDSKGVTEFTLAALAAVRDWRR